MDLLRHLRCVAHKHSDTVRHCTVGYGAGSIRGYPILMNHGLALIIPVCTVPVPKMWISVRPYLMSNLWEFNTGSSGNSSLIINETFYNCLQAFVAI